MEKENTVAQEIAETQETQDTAKIAPQSESVSWNTDESTDSKLKSYKKDCLILGGFLIVILAIRIVAEGFAPLIGRFVDDLQLGNPNLAYAISLCYSALCLQIIPTFIAAFMLKYSLKNLCGGFHPPKQTKKAVANFPAVYGAGMTVNLITMSVIFLTTKQGSINDSMNSMGIQPPTFEASFILFIMLTVIAPVFEEFIFRGAVLHFLQPYGNGIAIFVSAFTFGIYHGNFMQFFYATVLGIALGYITVATKSLFCSTLLHAMFNSISGIILVFSSSSPVQKYTLDKSAVLNNGEELVMTFYAIFMILVLLTALIGFIAMIGKIRKIKRFKIPAVWTEVPVGKKMTIMLLTVTVIISILLMADIMGKNYLARFLSDLITI